jgi:hypothetical protein
MESWHWSNVLERGVVKCLVTGKRILLKLETGVFDRLRRISKKRDGNSTDNLTVERNLGTV